MTTSFTTESVDQELQLTDLEQINGAMPILITLGLAVGGFAIGAGAATAYGWFEDNREDIADTVHDLISAEDGNSSSYREQPGSGGGGKYDKPVLK